MDGREIRSRAAVGGIPQGIFFVFLSGTKGLRDTGQNEYTSTNAALLLNDHVRASLDLGLGLILTRETNRLKNWRPNWNNLGLSGRKRRFRIRVRAVHPQDTVVVRTVTNF